MNEAINQETGEILQISETTANQIYTSIVRLFNVLLPSEWFDESNGHFKSSMNEEIPLRILYALRVGLGVETTKIEQLKSDLWIYTKSDFAKILARYVFHSLFCESVTTEPLAKLELIHFAIAGKKDDREDYEKLNHFFGYLCD